MMQEVGFCNGIENYSAHRQAEPESPPTRSWTSSPTTGSACSTSPRDGPRLTASTRGTQPQGHPGRARLPPAVGYQPAARFDGSSSGSARWCSCRPHPVSTSWPTPARSSSEIVRPTGLVDPEVVVGPKGQIDDLIAQVEDRVAAGGRVLVTTITKKMAEDLTDYLLEQGLRVRYLHARSTPSSASRSCERSAWASSTSWWASTCSGRASTCPRSPWWPSSTPTRRFLRSDVAHRDHRASGPQRRRPGGDVRRRGHRLHAERHLGDEPAAGAPAGLQRRARDRSPDHPQGGHRHPRRHRPTAEAPTPARSRRRRWSTTWRTSPTTSWPGW